MVKWLFLLVFFVLSEQQIIGQASSVLIGGANTENCRRMTYVSDNRICIAGSTNSFGEGNHDCYAVIMDTSGTVLSDFTLGTSSNDRFMDVKPTSDGNLIFSGNKKSGFDFDAFLYKTDYNGNLIWQRFVGSAVHDSMWRVLELSDGNYVSLGWTSNEIYIVKVDASGTLLFYKEIDYTGAEDRGYDVVEAANGDLIICGRVFGGGGGDQFFLMRMNSSNGNLIWEDILGANGSDYGFSVKNTSDGGFLAGGYTSAYGAGNADFLLLKYSSTNVLEWSKVYGGTQEDILYELRVLANGDYVLGGTTASYGAGGLDYFLIRTDSNGDVLWARTYGGTGDEHFRSLDLTPGEQFILGGHSNSWAANFDFYALIVENDGTATCHMQTVNPTTSTITINRASGITVTDGPDATGGSFTLGAGGFVVDDPCTALPVELMTFSATCNSDQVLIQWSTATETNNAYFELQRSFDGELFEPIATIPGAGNSIVEMHYQWLDQAMDQTTYYRIKQVDYNGEFSFYQASALSPCKVSQITHIMNPFTSMLTIKVPDDFNEDQLIISVYNKLGQEVLQRSVTNSGASYYQFSMAAMPVGTYIVRVMSGEMLYTEQIYVP